MDHYVKLVRYDCWVCSTPFAVAEAVKRRAEEHGEAFFCPRGCKLGLGKSKVQKLEEELAAEKLRVLRLSNEKHDALRKAKRYKCTSCTRDFATAGNLEAHIRKTHKQPLKLASKAGPDALNSDVSLKAVP